MIARLREWLMEDMGGIVFAFVAAFALVAYLTRGPL